MPNPNSSPNPKGQKGELFVVSAPSGAGKTSLVAALIKAMPEAAVSVSHTTRPRRPHEVDGTNYHFVEPETFKRMQESDEFLESATVFGNFYGTSNAEVERITSGGHHVILEIDWQGRKQIAQAKPDSKSIFILPPSTESLQQRLNTRGEDDEETIKRRMSEAISEMSHYDEFDYLVVNDDFDDAVAQMIKIVRGQGENLRLSAQKPHISALLKDLLP